MAAEKKITVTHMPTYIYSMYASTTGSPCTKPTSAVSTQTVRYEAVHYVYIQYLLKAGEHKGNRGHVP